MNIVWFTEPKSYSNIIKTNCKILLHMAFDLMKDLSWYLLTGLSDCLGRLVIMKNEYCFHIKTDVLLPLIYSFISETKCKKRTCGVDLRTIEKNKIWYIIAWIFLIIYENSNTISKRSWLCFIKQKAIPFYSPSRIGSVTTFRFTCNSIKLQTKKKCKHLVCTCITSWIMYQDYLESCYLCFIAE